MKKTDRKILGITKAKNDSRYVGAYLSPRIYNFITLYSLAMKINKTNLYKSLIDDWIDTMKNQLGYSESTLIQLIVKRIVNEWITHKKAHPKANYDNFKNSLQSELMKKGLTMNQVATILNLIES